MKDGWICFEFVVMSYVELMVEIYMIDFEVMKYLKFYC